MIWEGRVIIVYSKYTPYNTYNVLEKTNFHP